MTRAPGAKVCHGLPRIYTVVDWGKLAVDQRTPFDQHALDERYTSSSSATSGVGEATDTARRFTVRCSALSLDLS